MTSALTICGDPNALFQQVNAVIISDSAITKFVFYRNRTEFWTLAYTVDDPKNYCPNTATDGGGKGKRT